MTEFYKQLQKAMSIRNIGQKELCDKTGIPKSAISQYVSGSFKPKQKRTYLIAKALDVNEAWLMGFDDVPMERDTKLKTPTITDDVVTFPVIGEIAAGYDRYAVEDWSGETVEIPKSYLKGRETDEFFVLSVKGDSMYPMYQDGDKVLILKQTTVNRSGDVAAILYNEDYATLKKVEFVSGEDWLRLVPINPLYQPETIEGSKLEECRVMGIPKLLIREIQI